VPANLNGLDILGVANPTIEFAFPLDRKHILLLFERACEAMASARRESGRAHRRASRELQQLTGTAKLPTGLLRV
jgi:hypothetical protein